MKQKLSFLLTFILLLVFPLVAHATLFNRGTDSLGNRLIYDDDLDITWYDYTSSMNTWQAQIDWATVLTVDFAGTIYDDWRLPATVDGPYVNPFDYTGTTTAGYNITTSEWGHLYYVELGNVGFYDTSGNETGWPMTVTDTGEFLNWMTREHYWSGTEYAANPGEAWWFFPDVGSGRQGTMVKTNIYNYAMAVRDGDVAPVPEPGTVLLLGAGMAGFWVFRKKVVK